MKTPCQLDPVHAGHQVVGHHAIEAVERGQGERGFGAVGLFYLETFLAQRFGGAESDQRLVVDQQDPAPVGGGGRQDR